MSAPDRPASRIGIAIAVVVIAGLAVGSLYFATQAELGVPAEDEGSARGDGAATSVEDIEIDPLTRLPLVPLALSGGEAAWVRQPDEPLDVSARFASAAPTAATVDPEQRQVSLLAGFQDHQAALTAATQLAAAVGDPAAEGAWLAAAGQEPDGRFEWLGAESVTAPFVQVVDRWLLVDGLEHQVIHDPLRARPPDGGPAYQSPLAQALAGSAEVVHVEGDRGGEGIVAFELVCRGDSEPLVSLAQDLADQSVLAGIQPPWIEPGITDGERRARRTARLLAYLQLTSMTAVVERDPGVQHLRRTYRDALANGDEERIADAAARLTEYVELLLAESGPDLGSLEERLDPVVLEVMLGPDLTTDAEAAIEALIGDASPAPATDDAAATADGAAATTDDERRLAERFGQAAAADAGHSGDASFVVAADGGSLGLFGGVWDGVTQGLVPFLDYLDASGCDEIAVEFHDLEAVRPG